MLSGLLILKREKKLKLGTCLHVSHGTLMPKEHKTNQVLVLTFT